MRINRLSDTGRHIVLWSTIAVMGICLSLIGITKDSLWYDEAFTGSLVNHSFFEIVRLSAHDNHPPLYFFLTRLITLVLGNNVFALRLCSALGVFASALLGLSPVKRALGSPVALLYTLLVFTLPAMVNQAQNARMYTWAPFFLTAAVVYAHLAVTQNRRRDWIAFGAATVLGLYTHIYLIIECSILYALLFGWIVVRDRAELRAFLTVSGISSLLYLPWLCVVILQSFKIAKNFWIPKPSGWVFQKVLFSPFQHDFGSTTASVWVLIPFCVVGVIAAIGVSQALRRRDASGRLILLATGVAVGTFFCALLVTYFFTPIFWGRYFITLAGLYSLVAAYGVCSVAKGSRRYAVTAAVLVAIAPQIVDIKTVPRNGPMEEVRRYLADKVRPDDVFLYSDEQPFGIFVYYYPNHKHHLVLPETFSGYCNYKAFGPAGTYGNRYDEFLAHASRVWVVNRLEEGLAHFDSLEPNDITRSSNFYEASVTKIFSQPHASFTFRIDLLSANPKDAVEKTKQF